MEGRTKLNLTISVDDVHPEKGWGLKDDQCMKYIQSIHDTYGAKFTCFCPSNYHGNFPISQHKEWIDWLLSLDYIELAAHGHLHQTFNPEKWGECEFIEIQTIRQCEEILNLIGEAWNAVGHIPAGWRNPGWLTTQANADIIGRYFKYAAVHYEHNQGIQWPCKMIFGHDGIESGDIRIHEGNRIMYQSHIAGDWNKNVWNEDNYAQLNLSLEYLANNYEVDYKLLRDV